MRITKYEHANFVVELDGKNLVVDPGGYSTSLPALNNVVAIVVTHEHADHWTADQLTRILDRNPGVPIFGPAGFAAAAEGFDVTVVTGGDKADASPFHLAFYGTTHAVIHSSIPLVDNVGVLINDTIYHPGDSYTVPPVPVDVLGVPSSAPWLKIGEVMDFIAEVKPRRSFALHEMVNSDIGNTMARARIASATEAAGGQFLPLVAGESIEL
ncbi:MBL fold metallo-hydrolase [Glaciihabitans sp. dw_435]|uniref:MBL fold metallo-hydrolase n=1 Tax=Glaciihabitans sp. dw_435 TaxID=2720081 RepID=UPI001BD36BE5|nr:MBL fold metallo-hydrolase [Glaciihabitans sp. dw_435]